MVTRLATLVCTAAPFVGVPAAAQTWPPKPVRIIVPYAPGGIHGVARVMAQKLSGQAGRWSRRTISALLDSMAIRNSDNSCTR